MTKIFNKFSITEKQNSYSKCAILIICFISLLICNFFMLRSAGLNAHGIKSNMLLLVLAEIVLFIAILLEMRKSEIFYVLLIKLAVPFVLMIFFLLASKSSMSFMPFLLATVLISHFIGTYSGVSFLVYQAVYMFVIDKFDIVMILCMVIYGVLLILISKYMNKFIRFTGQKVSLIACVILLFTIYISINITYQFIVYEKVAFLPLIKGIPALFISVLPIYIKKGLSVYRRRSIENKLSELCQDDHYLIMELADDDSEVFYHSMEVADLATKVARALNADYKLVKAAAMYHEIGKLIDEKYISASIRILQNNNVPIEVIQIVREHNSKSNIPSTLESAIVMMADSIITAMEKLQQRNPYSNINELSLVKNVFEMRFEAGVLDKVFYDAKKYRQFREAFFKLYKN